MTENLNDYVKELIVAFLTLADEATPKRKKNLPRIDQQLVKVKNAICRYKVLYNQQKKIRTLKARKKLADVTRKRKKTINQIKRKAQRQAFCKIKEAENVAIF